ncbi:protein FAM200B-like [Helicoverpa armigera]|uniref:protein FAM200B-like n=1 Tax=Helicoverpa zea TaxID=7113 RepID=UPI001F5A8592|nr:protein FAM200B-like [Helicoverpa zea]
MPKRKCSFNVSLQAKYPFIKQINTPSDVRCEKCRTEFSVAHSGGGDIEQHLKSDKHKNADRAAASSSTMLNFFKKSDAPTLKDLDIAAAEGVWAYHTVQENHSFRSNDCASKLIQSCFDPKFTCARTKSEAIVVNVLTPTAMKELKDDLDKCNCITILNDASNHGNKKIYPIVVRFFQPYVGVQVKILDLQDQPGETSDIIVNYLSQVLTDNNLTAKVVAFCGDNANVNFGGAARRGTNNVLTKLQSSLKKELIGIGCGAHVIHNAVKSAADGLPVDYESVIVKIYSFFYIYTIRVEALKEFCAETETEYQQMLGYSKTRWLALMPALERVLKMYQPLKNYFLSIEKCPQLLKIFFEDPTSELWFYFLHAQSASFHQAVLKLEGQTVSAIEAAKEINQLKDNLIQKQTNQFLPFMVRQLILKLKDSGTNIDEEFVKRTATEFYKTSREYLEQWTSFLTKEMEIFYWADLKKVPTWEDIQKSLDLLIEKQYIDCNKDTEVFDEFSLISNYITSQKITEWNNLNVSTETRWVEIFKHFRANNLQHENFCIVIEYILCLPATNAPVERVFSIMNKLWTSEKTQLQISVLKAMLIIKVNIKKTCQEFHSYLKSSPDILKKICSSDKYKYN